ncbi:MAG: acetylglutamate kinase, partial [Myxococcota bacterium]
MSARESIVVVKLGGELLLPSASPELDPIARSLAQLVQGGVRLVVVHGGGPQTSDLMRRLGQEPVLEQGRRVTDADALWSMIRAVRGEVNVRLTGR